MRCGWKVRGRFEKRSLRIYIHCRESDTKSRQVKSINKSGHVRVCVCVCVCARAVNKPTRATLLGAINKTLFYQTTCLPVSRSYITQPSTPFQHCVTSVSLFDLATQPRKLSLNLNQPSSFFLFQTNSLEHVWPRKRWKGTSICFSVPDSAVV